MERSCICICRGSEKEVLLEIYERSGICGVVIRAVDVFGWKGSGVR